MTLELVPIPTDENVTERQIRDVNDRLFCGQRREVGAEESQRQTISMFSSLSKSTTHQHIDSRSILRSARSITISYFNNSKFINRVSYKSKYPLDYYYNFLSRKNQISCTCVLHFAKIAMYLITYKNIRFPVHPL